MQAVLVGYHAAITYWLRGIQEDASPARIATSIRKASGKGFLRRLDSDGSAQRMFQELLHGLQQPNG